MVLVNYGSSDEDDSTHEEAQKPVHPLQHSTNLVPSALSKNNDTDIQPSWPTSFSQAADTTSPMVGPSKPPEDTAQSLPDDVGLPPQSPYSAQRALLRDLTLPTVPNYNIPPSPPGSPVASTSKKFKHFLDLKKQGVHFNEKLSKSSALKNPSLMQKLMEFSDIDEEAQYATTLPQHLWSPSNFLECAFKEQLLKSQQNILKKREDDRARGQRESVDFVAASGDSSRAGTPRIGQKSAAERIMAGLDRGRSSSPQTHGMKRKTRFES